MIIVDLLASLVAPCIVPVYDYLLAKVNVPIIVGRNADSPSSKEEHIHPLIKGLPSAFIGNAIWGFTYGIQETVWVVLYLIIILWSIGLLICIKGVQKTRFLSITIMTTGLVLVVLTLIRICCIK